jgi:23S rRNA pseudouridine2605 synthase
MRLQKALAQAGVASRRASEELIRQGRVQVNGQVVTQMGVQVDPERDAIVVDGCPIRIGQARRYIKLHKPAGYLSVLRDDRGRLALIDLVPDAEGLHPVGRLDLNSEGLVLLTNDGALTQRLTHPRYGQSKAYVVLVRGVPKGGVLCLLEQGVQLEDGRTAPARVERLQATPWGDAPSGQAWLRIVIHEGRKRQVRRMCRAVGLRVQRLIRVRIGPIELGDLPPGAHRPLTRAELRALRATIERSARRPPRSKRRRWTKASK